MTLLFSFQDPYMDYRMYDDNCFSQEGIVRKRQKIRDVIYYVKERDEVGEETWLYNNVSII